MKLYPHNLKIEKWEKERSKRNKQILAVGALIFYFYTIPFIFSVLMRLSEIAIKS